MAQDTAEVKVRFDIPGFMATVGKVAFDRIYEASNEVRTTVLEKLSGDRKSDETRIYYVPGTRRKYQASSPGEPPAVASGGLRQSIKVEIEKRKGEVIGTVGTELPYGLALETGTRNMAARPWLNKSLEDTMPKIREIMGRKWF